MTVDPTAEQYQVSAHDTFPKLLLDRAERLGDSHASREKDLGIWQSWTWSQVRRNVQALACGLAAQGFQRGDRLAIIGDNRPRLYWAICAAQCLGGVPVPMYQDAVAAELQFVLEHVGARFALAEDQEQVDKLLEVRSRCPQLEAIIFDDARGMRHYRHDFLYAYAEVQKAGERLDAANPRFLLNEIERGTGEDVELKGKIDGLHLHHLIHEYHRREGKEIWKIYNQTDTDEKATQKNNTPEVKH